MDQADFNSAAVIIGTAGLSILWYQVRKTMAAVDRIFSDEQSKKIVAAVERIPSEETFAKLDALDPVRLNEHYKMGHEHANVLGKHQLLLEQHGRRLNRLEDVIYTGPERRKEPRE